MRGPGFVLIGQGRDFAVQSYVDFVGQAEVKNFTMADPEIDIFGNTAMAQYKWAMTYTLSGQDYSEYGRDLFLTRLRNHQWLIAWRTMLVGQS